jgi:hypothetical protein
VLVGARASQGVFGALLAPSALSLLTLTFHNSPERQKAFGIFTLTVLALVIGAVLLLAFTLIERRSGAPLVPPHVVRDRARVGAYAATALAGSDVFSLFLFLTFFIQNDLHFTPLLTGVSFLPFTAAVIFAATVNQTRVLPRIGARPRGGDGSRTGDRGDAAADPALPARSASVQPIPASPRRWSTPPSRSAARSGPRCSAACSPARSRYLASHPAGAGAIKAASVHGDTVAFAWVAGFFAVGLLVALFVLPRRDQTRGLVDTTEPSAAANDRRPVLSPTATASAP